MSRVIGHGRYGRSVYPVTGLGAAAAALLNRNVAGPHSLDVPYTPPQNLPTDPFAAIVFTPLASGVLQVSVSLSVSNGATGDNYGMQVSSLSGTGLTVTGGEVTDDGWVLGTNTPPVIGGVTAPDQLLGQAFEPVAANAPQSFLTFVVSQPFTRNVPVIIQAAMVEAGTGHSLAGFLVNGCSVIELP